MHEPIEFSAIPFAHTHTFFPFSANRFVFGRMEIRERERQRENTFVVREQIFSVLLLLLHSCIPIYPFDCVLQRRRRRRRRQQRWATRTQTISQHVPIKQSEQHTYTQHEIQFELFKIPLQYSNCIFVYIWVYIYIMLFSIFIETHTILLLIIMIIIRVCVVYTHYTCIDDG